MTLKNIFINEFGRLRSGWRFVIFLFAFLFFAPALGQIIHTLLLRLPVGYDENSLLSFVYPNIVLLSISIFVGWLCEKFLENLPFRALGCWFTKNWWKDLCSGLILGAAAIIFAAFIGIIFGNLRFEFNNENGRSAILLTLAVSLGVFVIGAAAEEAFFRGYMLQTFARAHLAWLAIAFTSLFFASAHLNNPNANFISTLNTALAGIWFGVAYLKTRNLWLVFGLHFMWNWMQGAILGLPVSGITELTTAPLFRVTEFGAKSITGASYGIEGGIASTIAIVVFTILIWFLPFLKPTEEMLILTDTEKPKTKNNLEKNS